MKRAAVAPAVLRGGPALALLALLAACDLGPDFKQPETALPTAWENASPGVRAAWPDPDWWRAFKSPQLDALMAQARAGNTDVAAAAARVVEADAQARIAGAPLFPSLNAQTNVGPTRILNNTGQERHHNTYQGLLNASYELDFWGKNRAALEAAQASAAAARFAQDVVWLSTASSVASTYFALLGAQDRLKVAHGNLDRAEHDLRAVSLQLKQGTVPQLAVVQQQSLAASVAAAIPPLERELVLTRNALALLTGRLPQGVGGGAGSLFDIPVPAVAAGVPSELLARRPDVQNAEAQLVAANADIKVARAQFFPSFSLTAQGGLTSFGLTQYVTPPLGTYLLLSTVTQPIFQGGALRGQLDRNKARYQELLAGTYRKAVLSAFGDVENALAEVKTAADEEAAVQRSVDTAQRSAGLASSGFRGGTGTVLDVLLSQTATFTARDLLVQARLDRLQSLVRLYAALGGGWTPQSTGAATVALDETAVHKR